MPQRLTVGTTPHVSNRLLERVSFACGGWHAVNHPASRCAKIRPMFKPHPTHVGFGFEMLAAVAPTLWPDLPRQIIWLIAIFGIGLIAWGGVIPLLMWTFSVIKPSKIELELIAADLRLPPKERQKKRIDRFTAYLFVFFWFITSAAMSVLISGLKASEDVVFISFVGVAFAVMFAVAMYNRSQPIEKTVQGRAYYWWLSTSWKIKQRWRRK